MTTGVIGIKVRFIGKIKLYITAPYFKHIKNIGLGTIENLGTITQDEINIRIENSGDVKLNLDTKRVTGSVHGNGDLYLTGTTNLPNPH